MKINYEILKKCNLFDDISDDELESVLSCLGAKVEIFKKGRSIFAEGEPAKYIGIVLDGSAQIVRNDYYGNRSIVAAIEPPHIFGESFACAEVKSLPIDVIAVKDSVVMLIESKRITSPCCKACSFHSKLISNLLRAVAQKNLAFNRRIEITSKRTTRDKLMTYLLIQEKMNSSSSFDIPFDRQALADYLEVDRSGLSAEISKLRHEGIIKCRKNRFTLL